MRAQRFFRFSPCGGQIAGTALMLVGCAVRRKLAYVSTVQTNDIKTRRVCPPQGVFMVFVNIHLIRSIRG